LYRILGIDLTAVHGLEASTAQTLLSEIGTDMSPWPTEKHFASWLGLAPHNDISGGKVLRSHPSKCATAPRRPALGRPGPGRTQTGLGGVLPPPAGAPKAQAAVTRDRPQTGAYCLSLLKHRDPYHPLSPEAYEHHLRQLNLPAQNARQLGWASLYSRGLPPLPNLLFSEAA